MSDRLPIEVEIRNGVGYVWNFKDVLRLRTEYRILGSFLGCGALYPRDEAGIPLLLNSQEIQVLKEEKILRLIEVGVLSQVPGSSIVHAAVRHRESNYKRQIQIFKKEKEKQIHALGDRIVEGKRKKLMSKLKKQSSRLDVSAELSMLSRESLVAEEIDKIQTISEDHQVVQLFSEDPWVTSKDRVPSRWRYPQGEMEKCRLLAFRKLWKENYFIGEGSKFGGDFLVYLGDPVRYHAKYIVICQGRNACDAAVPRPQDLVSKSRLGNQVCKTVLIAKLHGDNVIFQQISRRKTRNEDKFVENQESCKVLLSPPLLEDEYDPEGLEQ